MVHHCKIVQFSQQMLPSQPTITTKAQEEGYRWSGTCGETKEVKSQEERLERARKISGGDEKEEWNKLASFSNNPQLKKPKEQPQESRRPHGTKEPKPRETSPGSKNQQPMREPRSQCSETATPHEFKTNIHPRSTRYPWTKQPMAADKDPSVSSEGLEVGQQKERAADVKVGTWGLWKKDRRQGWWNLADEGSWDNRTWLSWGWSKQWRTPGQQEEGAAVLKNWWREEQPPKAVGKG
ncbi:hypothetical protein MA16_Dca008214 [Dendrobium catenatum]|uniref:Uncharacterized protein n=1 Tax=Dendrobium catenatum TaxID=906689 RepID=A0A2I0X6J1_9ASPA|nr:hypothetical protein MA16_Dca008214 [Dendrobium catenatum]